MPRISAASSWSSLKSSWLAMSLLIGLWGLDHETRVVAAETERVRQGHLDVGLARLVGHVVEIALRVGVVEVDRGRQQAAIDREDAGRRLDGAGGAQQVTVHRLGGADREVTSVVAEHRLDRPGLRDVAELRGRSMRVHVADVVGVDAALLQRALHGADRALALRLRGGEVVHVSARPIPGALGQDDRKSTRLNSSHEWISYAVFCLKKK